MWFRTLVIGRRERVVHVVDGVVQRVFGPGRHFVSTLSGQHEFVRLALDAATCLRPLPPGDVLPAGIGATEFAVGPLERAIATLDGVVLGALGPGRYRWWDELGALQLRRFALDARPEPMGIDDPAPDPIEGWVTIHGYPAPILWMRARRPVAVLPPGRYRYWSGSPWTLTDLPRDLVSVGADVPDPLPDGAHLLVVGRDERVLATLDGANPKVVGPGRWLWWEAAGTFAFRRFSVVAEPEPVDDLDTVPTAVEAASTELQPLVLLRAGLPQRVLPPGRYRTWPGSIWGLKVVPLSLQSLDVAPQDLLTEDQVPVRLKAAVSVRVVDPVKVLLQPDWPNQVYTAVQLAMREVVTGRTLEGLLADRGPAVAALAERARALLPDVGLALETVAVKDVILPGEVKDLLNRVTLARKEAEALGIRRREEVAATRQLANTARLLENNPVLLRLKELESLGELAARIERITLVGSGDLVQQVLLSNLAGSGAPRDGGGGAG